MSPLELLSELNNRIRILESKEGLLNERLLVMSKNVIEEYKKLSKEIKAVDIELSEVKKEVNTLKNVIRHMAEEVSGFAKKERLDVLEKYINLWNPMNFVTESEVRKIVKEMTEKGGGV